jgi:hypothetical protein
MESFYCLWQVLAIMYVSCNGSRIPERVVVYRLGGDDGMFEGTNMNERQMWSTQASCDDSNCFSTTIADIIGKEVKAIKKAFHELNLTVEDYSCAQCKNIGCVFCLPKITMVWIYECLVIADA